MQSLVLPITAVLSTLNIKCNKVTTDQLATIMLHVITDKIQEHEVSHRERRWTSIVA